MAPTKVILLSCGSYNPPTNMHLRMFEIARDHLHKMGSHVVVGGVISPVHDAYGKKDLAGSTHRCAMLRLALQNNDWIRLSNWETQREGWTKTRVILQHHQNLLNSWVFDTNEVKHHSEIEDMDWIPEKIKNSATMDRSPIQVKLLCGADLLESFGTPGLWAEEDIDTIVGQHGLVVVTREGSNPNQFIYDSDLLSKYMHNILIVTEWITNEISSTKIRRALRRGESVRYLLQDSVLDYIYKHEIYDARRTSEIKLELSQNNQSNNYLNIDTKYEHAFLTPSPSDITMETPSPVEIISIDIPDSILKKNYLNSGGFSNNSKIQLAKLVDDNDSAIRDKLIGVMSDNGNKLLNSMKSAYPGQAKQIIADETGESHILEEVGSINNKKSTNLTPIGDHGENSSDIVDKDHNCVTEIFNDVKNLDTDKNHFLDFTSSCNSNDDKFGDKEAEETVGGSSTVEDNSLLESDPGVKENGKVHQKEEEMLQFVSETLETTALKEVDSEEQVGTLTVNKEALEIDGKYIKSIVNSRKSPKKCKNKGEKTVFKDDLNNRTQKMKEDEYTQCDKIDSVNSESQTELNVVSKSFDRASKKLARTSQDFFTIQGSLDSVKFNVPKEKSSALDSAYKKSKSYESIKYDSSKSISYKSFEISYSDTLKPKSESTSQLLTANFCTECCLASGNLGPEASFNKETFYSVASNQSSPVEEDSTECDICSACNLDSADVLETKSLSATEKCDLCEMCNDINADFEEDHVIPYVEVEPDTKSKYISNSELNFMPQSLNEDSERICEDNDRFEIENFGLDKEASAVTRQESQKDAKIQENGENLDPEIKTQVDYDDFEIENCGLDNNVRSLSVRDSTSLEFLQNIKSAKRDLANVDNRKLIYASDESMVKYSMKFSLPKNVPNEAQSKYGAKKISRKGSFIMKDSGCKLFQEKRRYSSVDNLQHSRQILKLSDRGFHKSKGNKLVASADNIQSNIAVKNANAKLKKLQKSANDIDSLNSENYNISQIDLIVEDNDDNDNLNDKIKIRDSDMVKMILTKHGIKIISEKETAL